MKIFLTLMAATTLIAEEPIQEVTPAEVVVEIEEVDPKFEQDQSQEEVADLIETPEVEASPSLDSKVDQEMASILKSEEIKEEELEEVAPQVEDLSHLAKRPSVTIAQAPEPETENAYEMLPISIAERQKISAILTTMAENNVFKLLFEKKTLEKLGREIHHVHPIRFLGAVFTDPRLVHCMYEIRRSGFKWDGFIDGFSKRFLAEISDGNVNAYIPGFAASLDMKKEDIMTYVNYKDFEGLVLYLMEKSRQK